MPPMLLPRVGIAVAALLLPGLVLLPAWRLAGLGAGEDDVLYYFPTRWLFGELIAGGNLPWWNPWTGMGRPLLADPQAAVFYPFTWLFAALDPFVAYAASLWAHYTLALAGMYRLLRAERLGRVAALFGAVATAFCGFLLAHRAHLSMQHAAAWTPWVLLAVRDYAARGGAGRLMAAASIAALQCFAGHVQIALLTWLGSAVMLFATADRSLPLRAARWLLASLAAAGLFAVQALPTLEYVRQCTRTQRGFLDFTENSWNPASMVGLIAPMMLGQRTPNAFSQSYWGPSHQCEQFPYVGASTLLLALLALRGNWRGDPIRRAWVALAVFGLLLALGRYGPLAPLLYLLPGANLFRVPARALLLVHVALAALAAHAAGDLGPRRSPDRSRLRWDAIRLTDRPIRRAALLVLPLAALLAFVRPWATGGSLVDSLGALAPWTLETLAPLLCWSAALGTVGWIARNARRPELRLAILPVCVIDLAIVGWTLDVPAQKPQSLREFLWPAGRAEWAQRVQADPARLWVVTQRGAQLPGEYDRPLLKGVANVNVLDGIASLTDYGPFQPVGFDRAFGFKPWGEAPRAAELLGDLSWAQWYDVGWLLLCEPELPAPEGATLELTTSEGLRLFRHDATRGPAYLEDASTPAAIRHEAVTPAHLRTWIDTFPRSGPGPGARLILATSALPGWSATIDGAPATVQAADGVLLSVQLPDRTPLEVQWRYEPSGLRGGGTVSALTVCALLAASGARLLRYSPRSRTKASMLGSRPR